MGEDIVVIDWAFAGRGALAVDVGPFGIDASGDFHIPPEDVADVSAELADAYVNGLREESSSGCVERVRLAMAASAAIKFAWMGPAVLLGAIPDLTTFNRKPKDVGIVWWAKLLPGIARLASSLGRSPAADPCPPGHNGIASLVFRA